MAKKNTRKKMKTHHKRSRSTLGKAEQLFSQGHFADALPLYELLLEQHPDHPDLRYKMGYVYYACKQYDKAVAVLQVLVDAYPRHENGRRMLLASLNDGLMTDAMLAMANDMKKNPLNEGEYLQAFSAILAVCDWDSALPMLSKCVENILNNQVPFGLLPGFLLRSLGISDISCETMSKLVKKTGELGTRNIQQLPGRQTREISGNRIKLAYLSADFIGHPVGYFIYSILAAHNKDEFEIYCYSGATIHDAITTSIRKVCEHFINVSRLNEEEIAQMIYENGIDVLVDLGGYTQSSKLAALSYRPAPVSIEYLGYANSTGNPYVDFRITDPYADVADGTKYTETLLTMPNSFLCFGMSPDCPRSEQAPVNENNYITFGSFNHSRKLNPSVIKAWSSILKQTPNAHLVLKGKWRQGHISGNVLKAFSTHGIDSERITFLGRTKTYDDHVACYNNIDIALDTFPYTGTTTTCEALWMGVPVITLVGKAHQNRVSYSILKNIGFEETIAHSEEEYIAKAINLANNPKGLTLLRPMLHTLFELSPVARADSFVPDLEKLYLNAWEIKTGQSISFEHKDHNKKIQLAAFKMNENITIMLPQDLNQINTYVLTEQGDWYEDELRFLRQVTRPGMRVFDCSAEFGCYSLSLAKKTGDKGHVFSLMNDATKRKAIEESASRNRFDWLVTGTANDASSFLQNGIDILIYPLAGIDLTSSYLNIDASNSPLIMIHAMQEDGINQDIAKRMQKQGYYPYRLIPSLNLLIPLQDGFTPISWHRQVFFCKKDRAEELAADGFLIQRELESVDLPDDLAYWEQAFKGRAFANTLLPLWIEQTQEGQTSDEWEQVRNAFSAYAMAHKHESTVPECYVYLSAALNLLLNTEQLQSSVARLCTVARIATELGNYTVAIQAAQMVHEGITTLHVFSPDEPFLPISSNYDQNTCKNHLSEWMLAQALVQTTRLKHPTSFPRNYHDIKQLNDTISNLGLPNTTLIRQEKIALKRMQGEFISASELKENRPMFSIIIPTRERHDTLKYAIESALNQQEFEDYEVVVMDNLSSIETQEVAQSFNNPKIKYFRSPKRLPMHQNWELALEHSQGEYVFFLGDDDAIMPDALAIAHALILKHKCDVLSWEKANFWWNNSIVPHHRNRLYISTSPNQMRVLNTKEMLEKYSKSETSYDRLPGVYNSFVHDKLIQKIKSIHGYYFMSPYPDVSSAIVNAYFAEHYIFLDRGLSISGNSKHSTGCSHLWPNLNSKAKEEFQSEQQENDEHGIFSQLIESNNMSIGLAKEFLFNKKLFFPEDDKFKLQIEGVINSMSARINIAPDQYEQTIQDIITLSKKHAIKINSNQIPAKSSFQRPPIQGEFNNHSLAINCEQAGIKNPAQAALLIQGLWPKWQDWINISPDKQ